ncbi:MAG TPA: hypothetical protein VFC63_23595 [Blastocatellia bacterium]|nr:hypothetical protein [Blastocatellia bacterium]
MKPQQSIDTQRFVEALQAGVSNISDITCQFGLFQISTNLTQVNSVNQTIFYALLPNVPGFTFQGQTQGQTNGNGQVQLTAEIYFMGNQQGSITVSIESDPSAYQSRATISGVHLGQPIKYDGVIADWNHQ